MTSIDRRNFLGKSALAGGLVFAPSLMGLISCSDPTSPTSGRALRQARAGQGGYGGLKPAKGLEGIISIPPGFHARLLSTSGDPLDGGGLVPNAFDGMGAFAVSGDIVRLVRNHELRDEPAAGSQPFGSNPYDAKGPGGNTTLEVRVRADGSAEKLRESPTLTGTFTNCAGGTTPWGSWISCEEATPGTLDDEGLVTGWSENHGYNFEVPSAAGAPVVPVALKAMGRFDHEAVSTDPATGWVYQTEDRTPSGFYRFRPSVPGRLAQGGVLEALAIKGQPGFDTATNQVPGVQYEVQWVAIDQPFTDTPLLPDGFVFNQGLAKGAAQFARLEGCWFGDNSIFFNATSGGTAGAGQVWQYIPSLNRLILVFESPGFDVLNSPDNICVTPRGGLVICEDGDGQNFVRGLTRSGAVFDLVSNDLNGSEWAGACFSPQGRTLFVSIQGNTRPLSRPSTVQAMTFAIWGPWESGAL